MTEELAWLKGRLYLMKQLQAQKKKNNRSGRQGEAEIQIGKGGRGAERIMQTARKINRQTGRAKERHNEGSLKC